MNVPWSTILVKKPFVFLKQIRVGSRYIDPIVPHVKWHSFGYYYFIHSCRVDLIFRLLQIWLDICYWVVDTFFHVTEMLLGCTCTWLEYWISLRHMFLVGRFRILAEFFLQISSPTTCRHSFSEYRSLST